LPVPQRKLLASFVLTHTPLSTAIQNDVACSGFQSVKNGDLVLYARFAGTEIKMDARKLLILQESDILAVVEEQ
jgi:co-chaperonin GroES (HSP10)